jgi:hypothetical protein
VLMARWNLLGGALRIVATGGKDDPAGIAG